MGHFRSWIETFFEILPFCTGIFNGIESDIVQNIVFKNLKEIDIFGVSKIIDS